MRTSKFSESQIVVILRQQEAGLKVSEVCREHRHQRGDVLQVADRVRVAEAGGVQPRGEHHDG